MKVKNFANFGLWRGSDNIGYGCMEDLILEAQKAAESVPGKSVDICFVEFDGDVDDESTSPIKGEVILSYHLLHEGTMIVHSGK